MVFGDYTFNCGGFIVGAVGMGEGRVPGWLGKVAVVSFSDDYLSDGFSSCLTELERAVEEHEWPDGMPIDRVVSVLSEEAGEVVRAANNVIWHGEDTGAVVDEIIQTMAMCLRAYDYIRRGKCE